MIVSDPPGFITHSWYELTSSRSQLVLVSFCNQARMPPSPLATTHSCASPNCTAASLQLPHSLQSHLKKFRRIVGKGMVITLLSSVLFAQVLSSARQELCLRSRTPSYSGTPLTSWWAKSTEAKKTKIKRVLSCCRDEAASRESEMHQQKGEGRASQLWTAAGRGDHAALWSARCPAQLGPCPVTVLEPPDSNENGRLETLSIFR